MQKSLLLALLFALPASADEGMWTFDNPPSALMQERYGFSPDADWLRRAQLASLRFNDGGSGSFVSADGLVLTNHHVAMGQLQKLSTEKDNYVRDGFFARKTSEELRCPDLEINQLRSYEDVSARVQGALTGLEGTAAHEAKKAKIAELTKACTDATGLRCDVVELYQGGEFWLYRYKKYKDVRLVMAPEAQTGFFGGDYDNFTYPRFALDFAFFRVYEDGKPVRPDSFFKWSKDGAKEGEITFVTGHPGRTERGQTVAQLTWQRDVSLPWGLKAVESRIGALKDYAARGEEEARRAKGSLFGSENYKKARTGMLAGLQDPAIFAKKTAEEEALREGADQAPWQRIEAAYSKLDGRSERDLLLLGSSRRAHRLSRWAEQLVRYAAEIEKPDAERLEEFADAKLDSVRFALFSEAPTYPDLEEVLLANFLALARETLGPGDPFVKDALGGREPGAVAAEAARGTRVGDPAFRKSLAQGGSKAVAASNDPLIRLARVFDAHYRPVRAWHEENIDIVETQAGAAIAKAKFARYGKSAYPDATFTLRLSYGTPKTYELDTTLVPYKTTFAGLYARADSFDGKPPFDLAPRAAKARRKVDLSAPMDFVSTHDITGGNSGSPVVNKDLQLVGLIFDGNIQSLSNEYVYSERVARAVSVHSSGILESLKTFYGMKNILKELK